MTKVHIASGEGFPDALSAVSADAVLLLTKRDELPIPTRDALDKIRPDEIVIVGGTSVINASVETELRQYAPIGKVTRVAGFDRYDTSSKMALRRLPPPVDPIPPPDPTPTRTVVDGNGRYPIIPIISGKDFTAKDTDYIDSNPRQNGSLIVQYNAGKTTLFENCGAWDIRSIPDRTTKPMFDQDREQNDHIIYPGRDPGRIIVRGGTWDASQLNGGFMHAYPHGERGAELIEVTDATVKFGDMNIFGFLIWNAQKVVLRNLTLTGPLRTAAAIEKYGFKNLYHRIIEILGTPPSAVTLENVRWNGRLLTKSDVKWT